MSELLKIGISPENIDFSIKAEERQIADYQSQITSAAFAAWGDYWPQRISERVKRSDLFPHIAKTTATVARILGLNKLPRLGLQNGLEVGMLNYLGYCWEDAGQIWVGLDESWFGDISEEVAESGENISPYLRVQISLVMAEEVFHAYIREVNPALAEENIRANHSGNPETYWNCMGERAAKEFALLYVLQEK